MVGFAPRPSREGTVDRVTGARHREGGEDKKREDQEEICKEEKKERHYGHFILSSYHGELIFFAKCFTKIVFLHQWEIFLEQSWQVFCLFIK